MVVHSQFPEGSSSSSPNDHKYDVFLSFRGVDTRLSFTDHLHKALLDANISTFLDEEEIETGGDLKPELESAIKSSRASIIVLSKNYANSSWCLDELVLILEQRMTSNQIVIPIFYHVEPTHVRKQESSFGDAIAKHKQAMEAEKDANKRSQLAQKINRWIQALKDVADLKGENASGRLETKFIEEVVKHICRRLQISSRSALPQLIGMDDSIKFITSWLTDHSSHTGDMLTILGIGGIGKTSLAKYIFRAHFREFDVSSYIEDINRRCADKFNDLCDLQKQLCSDITKANPVQVHDGSIYTSKIENVVSRKKVFLVLDDIDSLDQLDVLLGKKGFHPGSKIIITSKNASLTESCALFKTNFNTKHTKHLLRGLHETQSRELLCFHAFMCNHPKTGYEEVLEKLVKYCQGHPMALTVLGKSLHNRDVAYWEGCLEGLKKEIDSPINNVLRMSFKSLPFDDDRELFKHIACFFVGADRDVTETILKACDINTRSGITNLFDRCLLSIGWNNELVMHGLLQDMGRLEVRKESPHNPWKRSRLWCHEESFKVLKNHNGTDKVLGLTLDTRMLEKEKLDQSLFELKTDALGKMDNLMLLQLNYVQINGCYQNFPEELRWLCMHGFPEKSIPSDLPMKNLVALDMSYSSIESFNMCYSSPQQHETRQKLLTGSFSRAKRLLGSLKILNLSFCERLHSLGGFDELPSLERLIVPNCIRLVEVCESIEHCVELVLIDMRYCKKLKKFPRTIAMLEKVETLLLDGCNLRESRIEIRPMESLEILNANSISVSTKISSSTVVDTKQSGLTTMKFTVISLPRSLVRLSLADCDLSIESFPNDLSSLTLLKELNLDNNPIVSLPNCVSSLRELKILSLKDCKRLMTVDHPPPTLRKLILNSEYKPTQLRKVAFDPYMSPLSLSMEWKMLAPASFEIEGMVKIQPMIDVEEKVVRSLGWTKLDFLIQRHMRTFLRDSESEECEIQMYYEFGIFSTIYGGEEMPNWITHRSKGQSISFIIPSSPRKLTGINFCSVQAFPYLKKDFFDLPVISIKNVTKNHTWLYKHCIGSVSVGGDCLILLSHWMFGMNEMEAGDHVTINVITNFGLTKKCGVGFVYKDGKRKENKVDVLGYYKSWNHIIGGDLTGFQLTTGQYILHTWRFLRSINELEFSPQFVRCGIAEGARFKEEQVWFRALSQRKSHILGQTCEDITKIKES